MSDRMEEVARRLADGAPLTEVLDVGSPTAWITFDQGVREEIRWGRCRAPSHAWLSGRRLRWDWNSPLPTFNPSRTPPDGSALALALCDPDGRVREAALGRARDIPSLLPLVAIRCADWAPPVRDRAREVLRGMLPGVGPEAMAVLAAVILRIAARWRGGAAREALEETLRACDASVFGAVLTSEDRATRRLAHRIAVGRGHFSPERLAALAATEGDVVIQDICAEGALSTAGSATTDAVLLPLLGSRQGRVRSAGVTALHRAGRHGEAEPFLWDRSGMVRACARWVLRQAGTDPVPIYRARCTGGSVPDHAPLGLAECGERSAALPLLWDLVRHPAPGVRAGAVAGLRVMDAVDLPRLLPLLDDASPRVVRETVTALLPWADRVPVGELSHRAAPDRPRPVRAGALRLLGACGGPAYLAAARRLAEDPDPKLRTHARRALGPTPPPVR
ncbi:hypothetical protein M5362_26745 [Streptomyces sp. Je 1-79]|uniref:hypothetical protein n=1 Tax=Streptomyces sp. Je 1-79 TaxID=2943847 RepID=UPI0021A663A8|nr:hypothetical protein [Streptomyces sp. Je 1-79]MCT4356730.1 hypothetical protein [Streptomyces sp. Je 1-79]